MAQAATRTYSHAWAGNPSYQAYQLLHVAFILAPVIAGIDKFTRLLTDWDKYLAPSVARALPMDGHTFMQVVGGVEIVAGLIVAVMPRVGAYIVAIWLWSIIVNLFLLGGYYDVALRDFGLSLGALALGRLSVARPDTDIEEL